MLIEDPSELGYLYNMTVDISPAVNASILQVVGEQACPL